MNYFQVVLAFLKVLSPEYTPMTCHLCGLYPKWLSCDGVSLALSKDKVRWDTAETIFPKDGSMQHPTAQILKQKQRMLLPEADTRELLHTFCTGKPEPLNCDQFTDMQDALAAQCLPLHTLITELYESEKAATAPIPVYNFSFAGNWQQFMLILCSTTSVALIIRPKIVPTLLYLIHCKVYTAEVHEVLSSTCPQLAHALCFLPLSKVSATIADLLAVLIEKVKLTHSDMTFALEVPKQIEKIPVSIISTKPQEQTTMTPHAWLNHLKRVVKKVEQDHIPLSTGFDLSKLQASYTILPEQDSSLSGVYYCNFHLTVDMNKRKSSANFTEILCVLNFSARNSTKYVRA